MNVVEFNGEKFLEQKVSEGYSPQVGDLVQVAPEMPAFLAAITDLTPGKLYEVYEIDEEGDPNFLDDAGDQSGTRYKLDDKNKYFRKA